MPAPLLTTKLYIPPPRPTLVSRSLLTQRLDEGLRLGHQLILLSAPAGFGKTTLLSEWVQAMGTAVPPVAAMGETTPPTAVAWLSLEKGDNDPARFWTYVIAALQTVKEDVGQDVLDLLHAPQPPSTETLLAMLINQLGTILHPLVLVLDDYHLITAQKIHSGLGFLLEHLPAQIHLVIASRADPPLPITRLRGRGQLTELRLADLRFSPNEAITFLNHIMGLELDLDDIAALTSRTEGWITGLQMAAVSVKRQQDTRRFIHDFTGSHRYILDYLVEEVLQHEPAHIQTFLLQTSILSHLTAPLCDAIVNWKLENGYWRLKDGEWKLEDEEPTSKRQPLTTDLESQTILEYLEQANLFIMPLDDQREWYRYHRLFSDLLDKRLQQLEPELGPLLHNRASVWFEQQGLLSEAIDHAAAAENWERAAHLVEQAAETTLMRSQVITLLGWVESLPDDQLNVRPSLSLFHAWALMLSGQPLEMVQTCLQGIEEKEPFIEGGVRALKALMAVYQEQVPQALEHSLRALELLSEDHPFLYNIASWNLGLAYMLSGDIEASSQIFDKLVRTAQKTGNLMVAVSTLCHIAELQASRGRLHEAQATYQQALKLGTDSQGQPLPIAGAALVGLGELARERDDLETATRYLTEGIERVQSWGKIGTLDGYITLARTQQAQGDPEQARQSIEKARQIALEFDASEMDDFGVAIYQARLWLAQDDIDAVSHWIEERGLSTDMESVELTGDESFISYQTRKHETLILGRLLLAQGRSQQALALFDSLVIAMEQRGALQTRRRLELEILRALAFQELGEIAQAVNTLEWALSLAEPKGFVRIFVDEGPPMAQLLYKAASHGIAPEYTGRLLAAFDLSDSAQSPTPDPSFPLIEPLTEREQEVLQLIAAGLSNQEIAQELVLSVSTVKVHTYNLYSKLDVHSRTQAVAKARTLGILPPVSD